MVEWGWPFRCFWGASSWSYIDRPPSQSQLGLFIYVRQVGTNSTYTRAIPYAPIWAGLTLSCALWASLWWIVLLGLAHFRRHLRLRRNHCPNCKYDLCATPPGSLCPECGHPKPHIPHSEQPRGS